MGYLYDKAIRWEGALYCLKSYDRFKMKIDTDLQIGTAEFGSVCNMG